MNIGVIALQGDFSNHRDALTRLGFKSSLVKNTKEIESVDGLVIPGGESTTLLKLSSEEFRHALSMKIKSGCPTLATCAGIILIAKEVTSPNQESLSLLDVTVQRNGYGRQVDSFIEENLVCNVFGGASKTIEAVFIRAPRITKTGTGVTVLAEHKSDPVLVKQGAIVGATFHPELSVTDDFVFELAFRQ